MLGRKEALEQLLRLVLGRTDLYLPKEVNEDQSIIKTNGNWFSRLDYNRTNWDRYCRLFEVVFGHGKFDFINSNEISRTFDRKGAISGVVEYFASYGIDVSVLVELSSSDNNMNGNEHDDPFGLRTPNPNADVEAIIKKAFCHPNGILFAIIVADEDNRQEGKTFDKDDIEQTLLDVLNDAADFIKRETSSVWCGTVPDKITQTENTQSLDKSLDKLETIECLPSISIESMLKRWNRKVMQFPFPLQISVSTPQQDMKEEEKILFYRTFALYMFAKSNAYRYGIDLNDAQILRERWLEEHSSGVHDLKIGGMYSNQFSTLSFQQIQIPITEDIIIEYIRNGGTQTIENEFRKLITEPYQKAYHQYKKYCNKALAYWDDVIERVSNLDFKRLITMTIRDIDKNNAELRKLLFNYNTAFCQLSPYKESDYTKATYLIIQRILLTISRVMLDNGSEMAQAFKDHADGIQLSEHKQRVAQLCAAMKKAGYDKIEKDYYEKNKKIYKEPEKIEDVFLYRIPNLISDFMTALDAYNNELDENCDD